MEMHHSLTVPGTADEIFRTLLDVERIAPCMPGATLEGRTGDDYQGRLKLRVGPITAAYRGTVTLDQVDEAERTAVLHAAGSEVNGQGSAKATVRARIHPEGDSSRLDIVTDVEIHGKAAQFGRGTLTEVTQRVLDQFARNLENSLLTPPLAAPEPAAPGTDADASLDVLGVIVLPMVRRHLPALGAFAAGLLIGRALRRRPRVAR